MSKKVIIVGSNCTAIVVGVLSTLAASKKYGTFSAPKTSPLVRALYQTALCDGIAKEDKYAELSKKLREIDTLCGIRQILDWDEMVNLPPGAADLRNSQKALLSKLIYERQVSTELKSLVEELSTHLQSGDSEYSNRAKANIRDARRDYLLVSRKSEEMAVRESELESVGYQSWVESRKQKDFSLFRPSLEEIIKLKQQVATATHPEAVCVYDGCLDSFERGMTSARLTQIFAGVTGHLAPLIAAIAASPESSSYVIPATLSEAATEWADLQRQQQLCSEVAQQLGFDSSFGRLDVSVHPFTGGVGPCDVRITSRYSPRWLEGLAGVVHETGHALYEQGRCRGSDCDGLPVSRPLSMGLHESQSLFWERMVFQSREMWTWLTPLIHKHFPHTKHVSADQFYRFVNAVQPGFIRVDADEVTYPQHVALRFELEQRLLAGSLAVKDLPEAWNSRMQQLLGLTVASDDQGVLQDIHWSIGLVGYFPSYSLGAMAAAQLFEAAEKAIPDMRGKISRGEFGEIRQWLRTNVHEVGSLYDNPDELMTAVTGKPLDPAIYVAYLEKKYKELYQLK
mmetsp:Transcript_20504/g.28241  ORF Transcript_20504/g.28241 Transcript_20504/m.28241 type:complete len:568 (+) Transcript_20504:3-1706(+)